MSCLTKKYHYVTVWEWAMLILALLILIMYVYGQLTSPNLEKYVLRNRDTLRWISIQKALSIAENGDIILMAGNTHGEKTCRWCSGTMFSHVGVLFWEVHPVTGERILYIFDCDLGQGTKEGVRVMPLRDKLHRYKGMRIAVLKKMIVHPPVTRPTRDNFVALFSKYIPIEFDNRIITWWVADWGWLYRLIKNPKTMFCSEFIASIFQDLNILQRDHVPAWYHPGDFYKNRLRLEEGYAFGESMFFEFSKSQMQGIINALLPSEIGMSEFIGGDISVLPGMEWLMEKSPKPSTNQ